MYEANVDERRFSGKSNTKGAVTFTVARRNLQMKSVIPVGICAIGSLALRQNFLRIDQLKNALFESDFIHHYAVDDKKLTFCLRNFTAFSQM